VRLCVVGSGEAGVEGSRLDDFEPRKPGVGSLAHLKH
jgi:hypothetical protein